MWPQKKDFQVECSQLVRVRLGLGLVLNFHLSTMIAPDVIIFLDITVEDAMKRGNFGEERYEKAEFQRKVRDNFFQVVFHVFDAFDPYPAPLSLVFYLPACPNFVIIYLAQLLKSEDNTIPCYFLDATQSVETIASEIEAIAKDVVEKVKNSPIERL